MLPLLLVVTAGALLVAAPVDRHTLRQKLLFGYQGWFDNPTSGSRGEARPSLIPSLCTRFTRAGTEWCRYHRAVCMARPR